jgi:HSP20 family protein
MTMMIRWNPLRELAAMQSAMDRMFEETWRGARANAAELALPIDVYETETGYQVIASLPGLVSDQVHISLHDNVLTISGELPASPHEENARALLVERSSGRFSRSIRLPEPVAADQVEAALENGILHLTLPKTPEAQPRLIPVRSGNTVHSNN